MDLYISNCNVVKISVVDSIPMYFLIYWRVYLYVLTSYCESKQFWPGNLILCMAPMSISLPFYFLFFSIGFASYTDLSSLFRVAGLSFDLPWCDYHVRRATVVLAGGACGPSLCHACAVMSLACAAWRGRARTSRGAKVDRVSCVAAPSWFGLRGAATQVINTPVHRRPLGETHAKHLYVQGKC